VPSGARSDRRDGREPPRPRQERSAHGPGASVLALHAAIGNAAVGRLLRKPIFDDKDKLTGIEFTVGDEIDASLAQLAKSLAKDGVTDKERDSLRERALKDATITDNERMFLAGLLDPANAKLVADASMKRGTKVTFTRKSIQANLATIRELGRQQRDPSVTEEKQIGALATGTWAKQAKALVAFAKANKVELKDVLGAMLAAGSDNTAGDMVMAGTVFAIAASVKHPMAPFLLSGKLKVDQLARKDAVSDSAFVLYIALGGGERKGDTIYVPAGLDITDLDQRADIVHELKHAADDQKAPASGTIKVDKRDEAEVRGYRAAARYKLDQIAGLTGDARKTAIKAVAKRLDPLKLLALMLETSDMAVVVEIRDKAAKKPEVRLPDERFKELKEGTKGPIETELTNGIFTAYEIVDDPSNMGPLDSFSGESLLDWADRPVPP
jgi:hypothetical protein